MHDDTEPSNKYYYISLGLDFPPLNTKDNISYTYYKFGNTIYTFKTLFLSLTDTTHGMFGGGGMVKSKVWCNGNLLWELKDVKYIATAYLPPVLKMPGKQ